MAVIAKAGMAKPSLPRLSWRSSTEEIDETNEVACDILPSLLHAAYDADVRHQVVTAKDSSAEMKSSDMKEIDETTKVPVDIYRSLLLAARDADVGQHKIVKGPKGVLKLKLTEGFQKDAVLENTLCERVCERRQKGQKPEIPKVNATRDHSTQVCVVFCVPLACAFAAIANTFVCHTCKEADLRNH